MTREPWRDEARKECDEVALLAERIMGYTRCPESDECRHVAWHRWHRRWPDGSWTGQSFDPMNYDRDFGALLDKCAERWPGVRFFSPVSPPMGCEQWVVWVNDYMAYDPSRRRALVLAAAAAVRAEGEGT